MGSTSISLTVNHHLSGFQPSFFRFSCELDPTCTWEHAGDGTVPPVGEGDGTISSGPRKHGLRSILTSLGWLVQGSMSSGP